ncbi:MmcQ/YjbR family DNA-binding protein [Arthrobacter gallicola]|uniref:MmcQ/YjbR family DNA-binding protein n=1 Tax=Arthrobacter gallicola TaxID=2762225 RepID=UPI00296AC45C|nr:MmcQ/YjbR family DNA-binding protein [Arthrobacter gallicola]
MEGPELQDAAREAAEELPGSVMGHPFGPEYEVFKVRGKVFMLLTDVPGEPVVVLKSDPEESQALRQLHRDITPGYHMNKKHWITLKPVVAQDKGSGETLDKSMVRELVMESYRLVAAGLPRAERPVDPNSFGK